MNRNVIAILIILLIKRAGDQRNSLSDYINLLSSFLKFEPEDLEYISSKLHHSADLIEKISNLSSLSSIFSVFDEPDPSENTVSSLIPLISQVTANMNKKN